MARKTSSVLEDLLDISRRLPWYINLLLAAIAYGVLHRYAAPPVHAPAPTTPADITAQVTPMLYRALAMGLQYVIPGVLLVGALLSFLQRRHSASLHDRAAMAPETIRTLSWRDFEHLTAEMFRRQGFAVQENWQAGPDGGVDGVMHRGRDLYVVQCKQWRARQVGVQIVRELYGVMAARGAAGGYVVTSGSFTREAQAFAQGREIVLLDGKALELHFRRDTPAHASSPIPSPHARSPFPRRSAEKARVEPRLLHAPAPETDKNLHAPSAPSAPAMPDTPPPCPRCGAPMQRRMAQSGSHAGRPFWGCSHFPACRGLIPISDKVAP